jgi:hypothetical protein
MDSEGLPSIRPDASSRLSCGPNVQATGLGSEAEGTKAHGTCRFAAEERARRNNERSGRIGRVLYQKTARLPTSKKHLAGIERDGIGWSTGQPLILAAIARNEQRSVSAVDREP